MLQNPSRLRRSAPWPLNMSDDGDISCTAPAMRDASLQTLFSHRFWNCCKTHTFASLLARCRIHCACHGKRCLNIQKWCENVVFFYHFDFELCFAHLRATIACTFSMSQPPKVIRAWCAFKHFLHRSAVHFLNIWTSKSALSLGCFVRFVFEILFRSTTACTLWSFWTAQLPKVLQCSGLWHFDFEMCFAPQPRALFPHRNFQKCSFVEVYWGLSCRNALRATTACNFSSLISPNGSAPAALASLLFHSPEPRIIGKTLCFATFLHFRPRGSSFLCFSLLWLCLFWPFLFSDCSHPCCCICPLLNFLRVVIHSSL